MSFDKRKITAQLNGLSTENRLMGRLEGKEYYAMNKIFPFLASLIGRILGFEGRCELILVNVQYI